MDNTVKRKDYISWDEYFMAIAKLSAMRSKDPSTQVGACIVGADNKILSIGYNGAPNGFDDDKFPWAREGNNLETKYPYVCHAEMNAILNYRGSRKDLEGAKIYVDLNKALDSIILFDGYYLTNYVRPSNPTINEVEEQKILERHFRLWFYSHVRNS